MPDGTQKLVNIERKELIHVYEVRTPPSRPRSGGSSPF
jgi:hypothetical protein